MKTLNNLISGTATKKEQLICFITLFITLAMVVTWMTYTGQIHFDKY
jgi:hypothetical protein